jgi:hypothetical protein
MALVVIITECVVFLFNDEVYRRSLFLILGKGKGKAIPLQALTGLEGSRRFWLPDFKTIDT